MLPLRVFVTEAVVLGIPVCVTAAEFLCVGVTAAVMLDTAVPAAVSDKLFICVNVPVFVLDGKVVTAAVTDVGPDSVVEGVRGGDCEEDPLRVTVELEVLVSD